MLNPSTAAHEKSIAYGQRSGSIVKHSKAKWRFLANKRMAAQGQNRKLEMSKLSFR